MSLEFLKTLFNKSNILPDDQDFYQQLLEDKDFLVVGPQVYSHLKMLDRLNQTPDFFREKLKARFSQSLYLNMFIKSELEIILETFEKVGIDVIPLKGVTFAEKYFNHLGARPTSDIDLLIKPQDLNNAVECIKSLGFDIEHAGIEDHFHTSFSKIQTWSKIPLTIEIHWNLLQESTASFEINKFWDESLPVDTHVHVRELSNYHTFYMICIHGWRHNLDSPKYYLDIIQLIHKIGNEIDYSRLMQDANNHKTLKRMIRTLSVVYQECPFVEELKPFPYKRSTSYLEYDAKKGFGGKKYKRYMDFIDYQFLSYDTAGHRLQELVKWVKTKN
ncbi:nucleotidyltransferase family protein [Mesobacillus foraminis]|uniref:Putative nucleotidyltransferase-like protein n=1 Tax=Mesobacillus foraminis TaxID=279826 RepID=A0A4R2B643_9BACI|nr:nucleotidyltransferase family protein [Mesobacillus foraminis]TCN22211.1 putative nucleotidyltransferase-like protein [Mesobacillus foraminis]